MHRIDLFTKTIAGCFVLATLGSSTVASAQGVGSFRDLRISLKGGERLEITETSGVTTEGRFVSLSDQSLRVMAESARLIDFPGASVARIDHLRSRKKRGALVGFVGGFVGGLLAVALTPDNGEWAGPSKAQAIVPVAAIFGGIGAAIGTGIGAVVKPEHQRIFQAPPAGGGLTGAVPDGGVLRARRW
jgi:hypothetical protein